MKRILIISNNVLCETDNNGKTLLSLIKDIPKNNVSQLYFNAKKPEVNGYHYFQLSDIDIVKGRIMTSNRGRPIRDIKENDIRAKNTSVFRKGKFFKRTALDLCLREKLWENAWYSNLLEKWLNEIKPEIIFFMAGDAVFAYDITEWIVKKYNCKLFIYVTDDYVLERSKESFLGKRHRLAVYNKIMKAVQRADKFFTICERMRLTYRELFGVDSDILINRCESLYDETYDKAKKDSRIIFIYAGSLYYGRDKVLLELAHILRKVNDNNVFGNRKAFLNIYLNKLPNNKFIDKLNGIGTAQYKGCLRPNDLKIEMNKADYPVFIESFEQSQVEKIRLSFSTKVSEYLSLGKPILAIGPQNIGSMDTFKDAAICVNNVADVFDAILLTLRSADECERYINNAKRKYRELMQYPSLSKYMLEIDDAQI